MNASQIIVLATPVFLLLIALEYAWGVAKKRNTYRLNDALNSIGLGVLAALVAACAAAGADDGTSPLGAPPPADAHADDDDHAAPFCNAQPKRSPLSTA